MSLHPKISICVPTYAMEGKGVEFLERLFTSLSEQTFTDFEVVVADNSATDLIKEVCDKSLLPISYYRNENRGMAQNTNFSLQKANGELIKILYQDDYLQHKNALEDMLTAFTPDVNWLATGCIHTEDGKTFFGPHYPYFSRGMATGDNTIGSPSVIMLRNNDPLLFDEKMTWLLDCDYYIRLKERYGQPKLLQKICVVMGIGSHQTTHILPDTVKQEEQEYITNKHL